MNTPAINLEQGWLNILKDVFAEPYMRDLKNFLVEEKQKKTRVFPPFSQIFSAFWLTPPENVKVVIIGQDPYHGPRQANGLCFSVEKNTPLPPSLQNIYKELFNDLGIDRGKNGDLSGWAKQGVLMLNSILTVRAHNPASHRDKGWEMFTDQVLQRICKQRQHLVIIAWGSFAQKKLHDIPVNDHLAITSAHPSPLSAHRGFFGSKPFSKTNDYLIQHNIQPIDWSYT